MSNIEKLEALVSADTAYRAAALAYVNLPHRDKQFDDCPERMRAATARSKFIASLENVRDSIAWALKVAKAARRLCEFTTFEINESGAGTNAYDKLDALLAKEPK